MLNIILNFIKFSRASASSTHIANFYSISRATKLKLVTNIYGRRKNGPGKGTGVEENNRYGWRPKATQKAVKKYHHPSSGDVERGKQRDVAVSSLATRTLLYIYTELEELESKEKWREKLSQNEYMYSYYYIHIKVRLYQQRSNR